MTFALNFILFDINIATSLLFGLLFLSFTSNVHYMRGFEYLSQLSIGQSQWLLSHDSIVSSETPRPPFLPPSPQIISK